MEERVLLLFLYRIGMQTVGDGIMEAGTDSI